MDEIDKRLRETADRCIKAYEGWASTKTEPARREELMEAVHELRKVCSRVEIEMATSDREEMTQRPIPIPPHRASRENRGENTGGFYQGDEDGQQPRQPQQSRGHGQRRPLRAAGGSGGGGNRPAGEPDGNV